MRNEYNCSKKVKNKRLVEKMKTIRINEVGKGFLHWDAEKPRG